MTANILVFKFSGCKFISWQNFANKQIFQFAVIHYFYLLFFISRWYGLWEGVWFGVESVHTPAPTVVSIAPPRTEIIILTASFCWTKWTVISGKHGVNIKYYNILTFLDQLRPPDYTNYRNSAHHNVYSSFESNLWNIKSYWSASCTSENIQQFSLTAGFLEFARCPFDIHAPAAYLEATSVSIPLTQGDMGGIALWSIHSLPDWI